MHQIIALKFRPQSFEDVIGQGHVTRVIKNAIDSGRVPHAFIFSGPRGIGKTSVARILAKSLNCEKGLTSKPCNECKICREITASKAVDVFEIDAASHTGVDNIRELIENARYAPSMARYKVFIIDEVHMLSKSAFNALLKTLEEPPRHVVFIMATTEIEKIPLTVLSRCQRYDFRRISVDNIVSQLKVISSKEDLNITDDAVMVIALQADGSMRDAESILEQITSVGEDRITVDTVEEVMGVIGRSTMRKVIKSLIQKDAIDLIKLIDELYRYGKDLNQLYKSLLEHLRDMMVLKLGYTEIPLPQEDKEFLKDIVDTISFEEIHRLLSILIRSEEDFKLSRLPKITLETILLRIIAAPRLVDLNQALNALASGKVPSLPVAPLSQSRTADDQHKKPIDDIPKLWEGFLTYLNDHDRPLYAVLSKAPLVSEGDGNIILKASSRYIAEQVDKILNDVMKRARDFFKKDIRVKIELDDSVADAANDKPRPSEMRAKAFESPVVKEVIHQFDGVIRDVRQKK